MSGAASQCDTFDYKPALIEEARREVRPGRQGRAVPVVGRERHEEPLGLEAVRRVRQVDERPGAAPGDVRRRHGVPAGDGLRSRTSTGRRRSCRPPGSSCPAFPSLGAWVSYGLGSENENLPTFVVLPDSRGFAPNGPANWGPGFLPADRQGTTVKPGREEPDPRPVPAGRRGSTAEAEREGHALLEHAQSRAHGHERRATRGSTPGSPRMSWPRGCSSSAPEVLDLDGESHATKHLYGLDDPITEDFGRNCLVARRLLERGVRFVQVWSGADNGFPRRNWDSHEDIARDHGDMGRSMDRPAAALIQGPESARPARRHDRPLDDRVRPDAVQPGRQGPRPQPVHVHLLAGRRRHQGRRHPRGERRVVVQGGRRA